MKLFILLALAAVTMAQMPLPLGYDMDSWTNTDMDINNPLVNNPYKWTDFISRQRGIYGRYPYSLPYPINTGLPSYGPFVRYGNTIVPYSSLPYGNIINQYSPVGPYTPFGSIVNPINDPLISSPYSTIGSNIVDPRLNTFSDVISPFDSNVNVFSPYSGIENSVGITPYSQAALFNLIVRGGLGKLDLYSKLILGRTTGLNRKMREVCPEVDGGLSYVSCLTDAHSKTFRCLKGVETHPRFAVCTHKPIIKKVMRDWYVHDYNWHNEIVKCLSTTTYGDKATEKIVGVPQLPSETEFNLDSDSSEDLPFGGKSTWNVEFGISTRQCFYKLRRESSKCQEAASQCPKFKKCYIHPIIKTLEVRKHVKQAKFVKMLDSCLAGAVIPSEIVPEDSIIPETMFPEMMF